MFESLLAPALMAAATPNAVVVENDVPLFAVTELSPQVSVMAVSVVKDSRCADPLLCFQTERLAIGATIADGPVLKEAVLELGVPLQLDNGTLVFTSTTTPPNKQGATALKHYRMDLVFIPAAR